MGKRKIPASGLNPDGLTDRGSSEQGETGGIRFITTTIAFRVYGLPVTQGSMRAITHRTTGRAILIHDKTPRLAAWRGAIVAAAREIRRDGMIEGAVALTLRFHLPKPLSMPKKLRTEKQFAQWRYPARRPDLSKLARAAEDALLGVLIRDDGQIVRLVAEKLYSDEPGAELLVEQLGSEPRPFRCQRAQERNCVSV